MDRFLQGLNERQLEAAKHKDGSLLVLAGAGSGKTRVLTHRIAHLIEQQINPWNILAVTFTNKAANEMRERVLAMTGEAAEGVWLSTFHSLCVRMLRRDIELIGYNSNFNIYDSDDQKRLMKAIIKENPRENVSVNALARHYLNCIERAKLLPRRHEEIYSFLRDDVDHETANVYKRYHQRMRKNNALDFNDLINKTVHLLQDSPEILRKRQRQFRYLMVDEYQDTNPAQYELIKLLSGQEKNVMVVGDDDQSIYGFRGADIENINRFVSEFSPNVVRLERNYRSHGNILSVSNGVISNNQGRMEKTMWTDAPDGELIKTLEGEDEFHEARQVRLEILELQEKGFSFSDMAIIYRTNSSASVFDRVFRQGTQEVPCVAIGFQKFYDRKEIKDIICYLKLLINPNDEMAFRRSVNSPKRGIGDKSINDIFSIANKKQISFIQALHHWAGNSKGKAKTAARNLAKDISELRRLALDGLRPEKTIQRLLDVTGYTQALEEMILSHRKIIGDLQAVRKPKHLTNMQKESIADIESRLENIRDLQEEVKQRFLNVEQFEKMEEIGWLQEYLDSAMLEAASDKEDGRAVNKVTMMTAHAAKGLEFPIVFVTGLSHGLFPHERALEDGSGAGLEEERRLAYVAFTRAKERLILSRPRRVLRMREGEPTMGRSIFWREVPAELLIDKYSVSRKKMISNSRKTNRLINSNSGSNWDPSTFAPKVIPSFTPPEQVTTREVTSLNELQTGVWIIHPSLGVGIIETRQASSQGLKLKVHFKKRGKIVIPLFTHCNLEIIEI
jgi:DNA helicase II / ATP-dependent DNA helicase PcrA